MPLYNPATAAPASQIATSGTPVTIANTPPTGGQVLQASSGTAAAWTTPAGGGVTVRSLASNYTLTSTMTDIPGFSWTLAAGTTYEFWFEPRVAVGTGGLTSVIGALYTGTLTTQSSRIYGNSSNPGTMELFAAFTGSASSWDTGNGPFGSAGASYSQRFYGALTTNTSGTFTFQVKSVGGAGTLTMPTPCFARVFQL